jgi:hypothetical protein
MSVGNALKIFIEPPTGTLSWVLLRNTTGTFPSYNDVNSTVIYSGQDDECITDINGVINGTLYHYCEFDWNGTVWAPSATASATAAHTYTDQSVDVLSIVRDRLDCGLQNEVSLGNLSPASGVVPTLNAPPQFEETPWPIVSVHVTSDGSGDRGIGEVFGVDEQNTLSGLWDESEGWLARVQLTIVGWSKNPDERIALRKALRKIIIGNLGIFDAFGLINIDFSQQDIDDLSGYPTPVYESMCIFSCEAPASVSDTVGVIGSASLSISAQFGSPPINNQIF